MYFDSFSEFIAMGRHGLYVWLSYGIFLAVIVWNIWLVAASRREALRMTKQAWRRIDAEIDRTDAPQSSEEANQISEEPSGETKPL